ncbi:MAG: ribosome recycling factor [Oscillospiraceae bacterium]|nr:ribosome recycling factor [Oscillospiraceae bacterium]
MSQFAAFEGKIAKTLEVLKQDFATIRAGRANASVLDRIQVDYYGTPTPIQQMASVSVPEPHTLVIQPWDVSALKDIERTINQSDLGINPQNDGKVLRLNFPQLTEERRRDLTKQVGKMAEDGKVAVRNLRREAMEDCKKQEKSGEMTEDDLKDAEKEIQNLTDKATKNIDELKADKEKELMAV